MADGNDYTFNAMLRAAQRGSAWQRAWWLYNKAGRAPVGNLWMNQSMGRSCEIFGGFQVGE
jgi:hypothetical protein